MRGMETRQLANGKAITFHDNSRRIAGDRWQVRLEGKVELALDREALAAVVGGDPGLAAYVEGELGAGLAFVVRRERNFVAAGEKERLMAEFQEELFATMAGYLAHPSFPGKFQARRCRELLAAYALAEEQNARGEESEEESGPADFSACFRD